MESMPETPARFLPESLLQRKPGLLYVKTTLADFAIITFAVPPELLAKLLPPNFEPEVFTLENGDKVALISAVPFRDLDFRSALCPWPKFSFGQTNYRAYAIYQNRRIVWFFGTSLATPFVLVPRHLWLLPWHHAEMKFHTEWNGAKCTRYQLKTEADWGAADVLIEGSDEPAGRLEGFADEEDCAVILTHPLEGFFPRRDGKVGTYSVWHAKLQMTRGVAQRAEFQVFHDLGLTKPGTKPHSVLLQCETEFTINLPPRLVTG